jgi:hypothetical protein
MSIPSVELRHAFWQHGSEEVRQPYAAYGDAINTVVATGLGGVKVASIARCLAGFGLENFAVLNIGYPPGRRAEELTAEMIEHSIITGTQVVLDDINDRQGKPRGTPVTGVGESTGASNLIITAHRHPSAFDNLILSAPVGINNNELGDDGEKRHKQLRHRQKDAANKAERSGVTQVEEHLVDGQPLDEPLDTRRLANEARAGIKFVVNREDGPRMVLALREMGLVKCVYVTPRDEVFKPEELEKVLGADGFIKRVGTGGHISLMTEEGCRYIAQVIELDRSGSEHESLVA